MARSSPEFGPEMELPSDTYMLALQPERSGPARLCLSCAGPAKYIFRIAYTGCTRETIAAAAEAVPSLCTGRLHSDCVAQ